MNFDFGYIKNFFEKYKKDLLCIGIIGLLFIICSIFTWGYYGSLFYDNGREAYLPQLILQGKVLYKDIFAMYSPLSYQFNALLYLIFGANLNILYLAGTINAFLIMLAIYIIIRQFINRFYSVAFVSFATIFFVFTNVDCINYIFPYSYALPYALCFMIYSALCGIMYLKTQKSFWIILSFLTIGLSVANKLEFLFCIIPLIICLFINKAKLKTIFLSTILFLLPSIISWGLLFLQGFNRTDFINYIHFLSSFFNSPEQIYYNSAVISEPVIMKILNILIYVGFFIALVGIPTIILWLCTKYKQYIIGGILLLLYIKYVYFLIFKYFATGHAFLLFAFCSILILYILAKAFLNKDKILIFLSLICVFSCLRFGVIVASSYAIYVCLLPTAVCWIYFIKNLENKNKIKTLTTISLLLFSVLLMGFQVMLKNKKFTSVTLNNKYDKFYNAKVYTIPFNDAVKWIEANTDENDTVLFLPEGIFINYITKRKTLLMYYHLIPNHISALGESNIVEGLSKNPPDYILLNNIDYSLYGKQYICRDFAFQICEFIAQNYNLAENYNYKNDFYISIYKKNKKNNNPAY